MIRSLIARGMAAMALLSLALSTPVVAGTLVVKDGNSASQSIGTNTRPSDGAQVYNMDTVIQGTATNRSAIVGFSGAQITTTSGSPTITLTTAPTSGAIQIGHIVAATGVPAGTTVLALASGTANTANATYTLSANATAAGTGVAMTSAGPQLIMAANSARRGWSTQNQGGYGCYTNGVGTVSLDQNSLLIPAGQYLDSKDSHVGTGAFYEQCLAAAMPQYWREW